jgi:hypothetical protein
VPRLNVFVSQDQFDWLRERKEVNRSQLFQEALEKLREQPVSDMLTWECIVGPDLEVQDDARATG